jgi:hypothetical protein
VKRVVLRHIASCFAASLVIAVILVAPTAALGQAYEPLAVSSTSPAQGAVVYPPYGPVSFEIRTSLTKVEMYVEIATQNIPGQDGTLADDFVVDGLGLYESDAFPGVYRGTSNHVDRGYWWTSKPGVYYWQAHGFCYNTSLPHCSPGVRYYKTPVYTIRIGEAAPPPPPPPDGGSGSALSMSSTEATTYLKRMIRMRTSGRIRGLFYDCHRRSYRAFRCAMDWRIGRYFYEGKGRFWHFADDGEVYWTYEFSGKRTKLHCKKRCIRRLHWQ